MLYTNSAMCQLYLKTGREFPGGPVVRTQQEAWVWSLVRELRSHKLNHIAKVKMGRKILKKKKKKNLEKCLIFNLNICLLTICKVLSQSQQRHRKYTMEFMISWDSLACPNCLININTWMANIHLKLHNSELLSPCPNHHLITYTKHAPITVLTSVNSNSIFPVVLDKNWCHPWHFSWSFTSKPSSWLHLMKWIQNMTISLSEAMITAIVTWLISQLLPEIILPTFFSQHRSLLHLR